MVSGGARRRGNRGGETSLVLRQRALCGAGGRLIL